MKQLVSFDWAAKKLLRSKANFGILEGFLSELLKEKIKIIQLLESESNKESKDDKFNKVDLLVEDLKGRLIIIEVQNYRENDYFHRMLYGTSKLISGFVEDGFKYSNVKKIISVNIVYFDIGHGKDYLYHGTTVFTGVNKNDILELSDSQIIEFKIKDISELYPEYYIIKVNQFNEIAKNTLDEWIYFLKNEEIQSGFKAMGIKEAKRKLDKMKMSVEDRKQYESYINELRDGASWYETYVEHPRNEGFREGIEKGKVEGIKEGIEKGKVEGIKEGIEKGKVERDKEITQSMLKKNISIDTIIEITGLSKEQIQNI